MLQWRTQARAAGCGSAPRPGLPSGASRLPSGPARDPDRGRSWPGHHRRPRDGRRSGGIRPDAMGGGAALTAGRLGTQRCRWRGRPRRDGICLPGAADRGPRRRGAQRGDGGGRGRLYEGDSATSDSETCPLTAPLAWSARSNGRNWAQAHGIGRAGGGLTAGIPVAVDAPARAVQPIPAAAPPRRSTGARAFALPSSLMPSPLRPATRAPGAGSAKTTLGPRPGSRQTRPARSRPLHRTQRRRPFFRRIERLRRIVLRCESALQRRGGAFLFSVLDRFGSTQARPGCLIRRFDDATVSLAWKNAFRDAFAMAVPRPRTLPKRKYGDSKLRPWS